MKRSKLPDLEAHKLEFKSLFECETDRGLALVGAAFLDDAVMELLRAFFVDDSKTVGEAFETALSTFGNRCKIAYCLGLIGPDMFFDLNRIRKIRNDFAHAYSEIDFSTSRIKNQCLNLRIATLADPSKTNSPRDCFISSVTLLAYYCLEKTTKIERQVPGKDYRTVSTCLPISFFPKD